MNFLLRAIAVSLMAAPAAFAQGIEVNDIAGRQVTLDGPAERVALAEARQLVAMSLVDPDFADHVAGFADLPRLDAELQKAYFAAFPRLAALPTLDGNQLPSAEKVIAARPDLMIMSGNTGATDAALALARTLEGAGIPTIFVDFRVDPFANTVPSLRILGKALGREDEAAAFIDFYETHRDAVDRRIAGAETRPAVLLHLQATRGNDLMSPGRENLGAFLEAAGGDNIGAGAVPGMFGALSAEYVLAADPDVYIATGGTHFSRNSGVVVGPEVADDTARASLRDFVDTHPILSGLSAVRGGRAHGLWHNFHNNPLNVVALEAMAAWLHPDLFPADLARTTLDEINARFLPVPIDGALMVDLDAR